MSVNVDGVVFGLQALLPLLAPDTAIVVTASLAARQLSHPPLLPVVGRGVAPSDCDGNVV